MKPDVLLVEDNEQIQINNKSILERAGYTVRLAMDLDQAGKMLADRLPDAIVLDISLPDGNGLDYLKELRRTSQIPVLLLTAMSTPEDTTAGLDAGSDDYLVKPYNNREFRARIDALLRRAARVPDIIRKDSLSLDPLSGQAFIGGDHLGLSQKEFALLLVFVQHEGEIMSADYLYEKVWARPMADDKQAVQTTISRFRKKIEPAGYEISAIRGKGYVFEKV